MNRQKLSRFYVLAFVSIFLASLTFGSTITRTKALTPGADSWVVDATLHLKGDRDSASSPSRVPMEIYTTLDTDYNFTPAIALYSYSFAEEDQSPSDIEASGVTHTFSSDYGGSYSEYTTDTVRTMYQYLKLTDEDGFSQYDLEVDTDIITHYNLETVASEVNTSIQSYSSSLTYENFSMNYAQAYITLDGDRVDSFLAEVKEDPAYQTVATEYATNEQKIVNLFDDYFASNLLDFNYAVINTSTYDTGHSIADELHDVLGQNASDEDLLGADEIGSIRNGLIGYAASVMADADTIGAQGEGTTIPEADNGRFESCVKAATGDYIISFNVLSDLLGTNNTILTDIGLAFTQLLPHVEGASGSTLMWYSYFFIIFGFTAVVFLIGIVADLDRKKALAIGLIVGLIIAFLVLWGQGWQVAAFVPLGT